MDPSIKPMFKGTLESQGRMVANIIQVGFLLLVLAVRNGCVLSFPLLLRL